MSRAAHPDQPLFTWQRLAALRRQRCEVAARLARLKPNSHKSVEIRIQLRSITADILRLEQSLRNII